MSVNEERGIRFAAGCVMIAAMLIAGAIVIGI